MTIAILTSEAYTPSFHKTAFSLLNSWGIKARIFSSFGGLQRFSRSHRIKLVVIYTSDDLSQLKSLKTIHNTSFPILAVIRDTNSTTAVTAISIGADDFIHESASNNEFLARIRAILIRSSQDLSDLPPLAFPPYKLDLNCNTIYIDTSPRLLSNKEALLAAIFFQNVNKALSRNFILDSIWGLPSDRVVTRTLDSHVYRLRKKLFLDGRYAYRLSTIYRLGYQLSHAAP
ncbi:response regulator transcription factor [Halomonas sp. 328]|uniref:response regulator transcription factor n=1 Tax=Halomonas sp. 328 TaxID=2776704 RepID=UPI0018A6DBAF|nr:response regulator transcription factor [Halomonas sp. 328]MBF8224523.1 response regulator transcription factor [Halomonas sp. 328]